MKNPLFSPIPMKCIMSALVFLLCLNISSKAQDRKSLIPINVIPYEEVTLEHIKSTQLSSGSYYTLTQRYGIPCWFYYRTNEGRYGKLEYLSKDGFKAIFIRWTTYNADGSVYSSAQANLEIPQQAGCDLDLGIIKEEGADFNWKYTQGYSANNPSRDDLVPRNGAAFRKFERTPNRSEARLDKGSVQQNQAAAKGEEISNPDSKSASTASASVTALSPQRRLALLIGNAAYPDNAALRNPVNDATDIATALREMGFEVITTTNANRQKMETAIEDFGSRLKNYNLGFFYYAGHGVQIDGENYLIPIDAKLKSQGEVRYECYPVGRILAKMEEAAIQANVIVLDACRDNPFARSWSRSLVSGGLANINAPQGTFIGFATSPGSTAADGEGRNGVYTAALLEHLRKPNLTLDQLFNAVSGSVKKKTNNQQVPWKASSMSEDLYLRN
jgi:hypothetical protein